MANLILYQAAFIKLDENLYVPLVLSGYSNEYEIWSNKRVKSWRIRYVNNKLAISKEEILDDCENIQNAYGVSISPNTSRGCTHKEYIKFFERGIKNALTLEEYESRKVYFKVECFSFSEDTSEFLFKKNGKNIYSERFFNKEDFFKRIEEANNFRNGTMASLFVKPLGLFEKFFKKRNYGSKRTI